MTTTDKSLNLAQRMLGIMGELRYVQKENKKVNGQYTFVSHDAVTGAVHDLLVKWGVLVMPTILEERQEWGTDNKGNPQGNVKLRIKVEFINGDNMEERLVTESIGYGIDNQDKGPGKAYSYAYKYALLKALCLETGDDVEKDLTDCVPEKPEASDKEVDAELKPFLKQFEKADESRVRKYMFHLLGRKDRSLTEWIEKASQNLDAFKVAMDKYYELAPNAQARTA